MGRGTGLWDLVVKDDLLEVGPGPGGGRVAVQGELGGHQPQVGHGRGGLKLCIGKGGLLPAAEENWAQYKVTWAAESESGLGFDPNSLQFQQAAGL